MKVNKLVIVILPLVGVLITSQFIPLNYEQQISGLQASPPIKQYQEHEPIRIQGNVEFHSAAALEGWSGDGSQSNPYIIEGLNITGSSLIGGIAVSNTDVHFNILNCLIERSRAHGIHFYNVRHAIISDNKINNNCEIGIHIQEKCPKITISNNIISNNSHGGIIIGGWWDSNDCFISGNYIVNNGNKDDYQWHAGLDLLRSRNNTIINNVFKNNGLGMGYDFLESFTHNVQNNSVNGKSLIYWHSVTNKTVPASAGQIILVNCTSISVKDQNLSNASIGLLLFQCSNLTIHKNFISNNTKGGISGSSSNSTISNNVVDNNYVGIYIEESVNTTISDNFISNNVRGIGISCSSEITASNNTISDNEEIGIRSWVSECVITRNRIHNNGKHGISIELHDGNIVSNNTISSNNVTGLRLSHSGKNEIIDNAFVHNGMYVYEDYQQALVINNSVNGKPLIFKQNETGETIAPGAGQIILVNCTNINIMKQELSNASIGLFATFCSNIILNNNTITNNCLYGVYFVSCTSSTLSNNSISNNSIGVLLVWCENISISDNSVCDSKKVLPHNWWSSNIQNIGIHLIHTYNCDISNNDISNNLGLGVFLIYSQDVNILENIISNNGEIEVVINDPFLSWWIFARAGIVLSYSDDCNIFRNIVSHNHEDGIYLYSSNNNIIFQNSLINNNKFGIYLSSNNNTILKNNFIGNNPDQISNSSQAFDSMSNSENIFILNYWDDWISPDDNVDGIVDQPYLIDGDANNRDSYPLVSPYPIQVHIIVGLKVLYPNGGEVLNGTITISWTPAFDSHDHSISYSIFYSFDKGSTWVLLASDISGTTYVWDTSSLPVGTNYMVKVVAKCSEGLIQEESSDGSFTLLNIDLTISSSLITTTISRPRSTPGLSFHIVFLTILLIMIKKYCKCNLKPK